MVAGLSAGPTSSLAPRVAVILVILLKKQEQKSSHKPSRNHIFCRGPPISSENSIEKGEDEKDIRQRRDVFAVGCLCLL